MIKYILSMIHDLLSVIKVPTYLYIKVNINVKKFACINK
jgi:hypothetical protein